MFAGFGCVFVVVASNQYTLHPEEREAHELEKEFLYLLNSGRSFELRTSGQNLDTILVLVE